MTASTKPPTSPFGWDLVNDLGALPQVEDVIIDHLLERLQRGQIYTWVGSLLLVLNPYNEIPLADIYSAAEFSKYENVSDTRREELCPHIFAIAAKAHYSLTEKLGCDSQVIVISGATGTGKTFNASKCLEYLSVISKKPASHSEGDYAYNILQRITDACRLISAFTTACTERNEVSSRHGQLVRLHYNAGAISGAAIHSFLLERSRVTRGSSNFQIFYQIIFGMSDTELASLHLSRDEEYNILHTIEENKRKHYANNFQETLRAFDILNFGADERRHVFQTLALLIHMGNIRFVEKNESCKIDVDNIKSREALSNTCQLSYLGEESVSELLTTILINPQSRWRKHTMCHRNLATVDACRNRLHSIIRHIYDLLFQWILDRTNNSLSARKQCTEWLGILDIFGFESFTVNGIEQLCVNYANEKMQQYFMEMYLESSRKELKEEGFINEHQPLDTINLYKERLCVLEEGVFLTLNDACQCLVPIDMPTIVQLACSTPCNKERRFLKEREGKFIIEHYSGPVAYCIKDLLSKNTDKVPTEITEIFNTSRNKFLCSLLNMGETQQCNASRNCSKKTMLAKLKFSMNTLIKELNKCDLYYVRCVKPCRLDDCNWDKQDFRKQLACTGIFDALPLAKCQYPIRVCYLDFYKRYSKKTTALDSSCEETFRDKCKIITEAVVSKKEISSMIYHGKRLIFLTESIFLKLERFRRNYRILCANRIQSFWLRHRQKRVRPAPKCVLTTCASENLGDQVKDEERRQSCHSEDYDDVFLNAESTQRSSDYVQQTNIFGQSCCDDTRDDSDSTTSSDSDNFKKRVRFLNPTPPRRSSISRKLRCNCENWKKKFADINSNAVPQLKDQFVIDCLKNITRQTTTVNQLPTDPPHKAHFTSEADDDERNNNVVTKQFSLKERNKEKYVLLYDEERSMYTIQLDTYTLFYKNRILSKQQLIGNPQSAQTNTRRIVYSRIIPHVEVPRGLQDCL